MDLTWDPPANASEAGNVTVYHLWFKPKGREHYREMTVDGSATSVVLARESGLIPQTTYDFGVRAQSGDGLGDWKIVSTYVGMFTSQDKFCVGIEPLPTLFTCTELS